MFAGILAWWVGAPTWLKRLIMYAGIAVALFFAFKWITNHYYAEGKAAGRVEMTKDILKQKEAEWKQKESQIQIDRMKMQADIDAKRSEISAAFTELQNQRNATKTALNKFLGTINSEREAANAQVGSIPAAELDNAIRVLSNKLGTTSTIK